MRLAELKERFDKEFVADKLDRQEVWRWIEEMRRIEAAQTMEAGHYQYAHVELEDIL